MIGLVELTRGKVAAGVIGLIVGGDAAGADPVATLSAAIVGAAYILAEAWVDCRRREDAAPASGATPAGPTSQEPALGFEIPAGYVSAVEAKARVARGH